MIITADHIRRFPFAVAPHRITDDLEALIAEDMAASAKAEGHSKRLPPVPQPFQEDALLRQAECEAAIIRLMMAGFKTIWQFRTQSKWERADLDRAVAAMLADGRILQGKQSRMNSGFLYTINPAYQARIEGDAA